MPPYVVYMGQNVYETWCVSGIKGAVYSSTKSGWFDTFTFTDFFKKIFLPSVKRQPGRKLMFGDNLSSHLSIEVIDLCRENQIEFVCLLPNSTDKLQPLDVGVFGPLKSKWKKQVQKYKNLDPKANLLQKTVFPAMLKELVADLNLENDLPHAFKKCGLVPFNPEKVKQLIPSVLKSHQIARDLDGVLADRLVIRRFGDGAKKRPRGKKVPAGQSYTARDEDEKSEEEREEEREAEREEEREAEREEEREEEAEEEAVSDEDDQELPDIDTGTGNHVVATYEGEWFLAEICRDQSKVATGYTRLKYMQIKGNNAFASPLRPDLHVTLNEDIILRRVVPEPVNQRGYLGLCKFDLKKVQIRMVLVYKSSFVNKIWFFLKHIFPNCNSDKGTSI